MCEVKLKTVRSMGEKSLEISLAMRNKYASASRHGNEAEQLIIREEKG